MNEEKILSKLIEHDERLDRIEQNMATKSELGALSNAIDKVLVIVQKLDQERIFTYKWISRIEGDIDRIKRRLDIA
ncbi:MAG: hypothetical protein IT410_03995 [Candidatus Doudnabacteria bacterium]|nr:hypothetical protein [Candidatus Doudnabacteria bacterium]